MANRIVRRGVVKELGSLRIPESLPLLISLLDDPDAFVRYAAANGVATISGVKYEVLLKPDGLVLRWRAPSGTFSSEKTVSFQGNEASMFKRDISYRRDMKVAPWDR